MSADRTPVELVRLDGDAQRPEFTCADDDIDEFFHKDSIVGGAELMCVTYLWREHDRPVAFFSVFNDAVRREECPRSTFERVARIIPRQKRYASMPAVKIGRLGVHSDFERRGIGSRILDYLKVWFAVENKTGCRFILVDAYNRPKTVAFYKKNGFEFLVGCRDENEETRIMYFDLIPFAKRSLEATHHATTGAAQSA